MQAPGRGEKVTYKEVKAKLGGKSYCIMHCMKCGSELRAPFEHVAYDLIHGIHYKCHCGGHIKEIEELFK